MVSSSIKIINVVHILKNWDDYYVGLALQWKSINSNIIEIKKVNINDAYNLSVKALNSCITVFGEKNIQTAKIYRLVGSILYYMER